jgi:hypothetical protein
VQTTEARRLRNFVIAPIPIAAAADSQIPGPYILLLRVRALSAPDTDVIELKLRFGLRAAVPARRTFQRLPGMSVSVSRGG